MAPQTDAFAGGFRVGVIGMGKAGPAVASALRANGHQIVAVSARGAESQERASLMLPGVPIWQPEQVAAGADLVILGVPDNQIQPVAESLAQQWHPGQVVVHLSGAAPVAALAAASSRGAVTMSVHPAMTFSGTSLDVKHLEGCPVAVSAPPLAYPLAEALTREIGGEPFPLPDHKKVLYHAAMAHASNHLVTLISSASDMLRAAGISAPEEYLRSLTAVSLERALFQGMGALTGPVERGDDATVAEHLAVLEDTPFRDLYRCLSEATRTQLEDYRRQQAAEETSQQQTEGSDRDGNDGHQ